MKKIISLIIAGALLTTSAGLTAMADYNASDYDIVDTNLTFDNGTGTGVDGTNAQVVEDTLTTVMTTTLDTTEEFLLSFDFNFTNASANINTPRTANSNNVGLTLALVNGELITHTSSTGTQSLGALTVGEWYALEVEGKTGKGSQFTTGRLYKYVNGTRTLVQETTSLNMRNLSSNNRTFNRLDVKNVTIDNIKLVALKPDAISLSSTVGEMDAGTDNAFDYVMTRQGTEYTKYPVTWSVYDEANETPVTDDISITSGGVLSLWRQDLYRYKEDHDKCSRNRRRTV